MKQETLKNFDLTWLPLTALILFVVCFVLYSYWTYREQNKAQYEKAANIPLDELPALDDVSKGVSI
jgi:cbb3-type cytochrome oxidase subunit 3